MQALQLLNQGQLDEAIASAIDAVRNQPGDAAAREILAELFCLRGDYERADKQCEALVVQQPQAAVAVSLLRQLIRAETSRRECWRDGRVPEFIGESGEACQQTLAALLAFRAGDAAESIKIVDKLEAERPATPGTCNGEAFDDIRDLDDLCAYIWEVLTSTGKYYWIPTNRILSAEFAPVTRPRDLLWRQCEMSVEDGPSGVVYIPALYVATDQSQPSAERLGRATNWLEEDGLPVRGVGQRIFLVGEHEVGIMEVESLAFPR
jgi:type VI secretion system protein ImpE